MTNEQKIEAAKHIQAMIANDGGHDEIDARVWCLLEGVNYIGDYIDGYDAYDRGNGIFYIGDRIVKYTRSIDAQQGILDGELKDWKKDSYENPNGYHRCVLEHTQEVARAISPNIITEPLARLYAILSALIWTWENEV